MGTRCKRGTEGIARLREIIGMGIIIGGAISKGMYIGEDPIYGDSLFLNMFSRNTNQRQDSAHRHEALLR